MKKVFKEDLHHMTKDSSSTVTIYMESTYSTEICKLASA